MPRADTGRGGTNTAEAAVPESSANAIGLSFGIGGAGMIIRQAILCSFCGHQARFHEHKRGSCFVAFCNCQRYRAPLDSDAVIR